jgi:hypothetical protein
MINRRACGRGDDAFEKKGGGNFYKERSSLILARTSTARAATAIEQLLLPSVATVASFLPPWHWLSIPCHPHLLLVVGGKTLTERRLPGLTLAFLLPLLQPLNTRMTSG